MSFLSTVCDKFVGIFSFAGFATLLLILVLGCASPMQQKQVSPATVKEFERDETLPLTKPVTPSVIPESYSSSKHTTSQEIEVQDNLQIDSAPIEKE
jgi:hypothetical protein